MYVAYKNGSPPDVLLSNRSALNRFYKEMTLSPHTLLSYLSSVQELMEHIENVHLGRQYPCDRCERVLSNRRALIRHVRYVLTFTLY
jgi:hypothetical protein